MFSFIFIFMFLSDSLESRQLNAEVVTPGSGIDLEYETEGNKSNHY